MPKLLWVALPVAVAAAWVIVQALRGRTPSRLALNVVFSLLLAGYVIGTAALGIFWVANQQLPVFDWHYLFGYTTAVLVAVHLAFNWRVVWRFLRGRRSSPPAESEAASPRRVALGWLGGAGLLAAGGLGFVLGLRHGRTEVRIDLATGAGSPAAAAAGPADARAAHAEGAARAGTAAAAAAMVERFHAFSALSRRGVLRRAPGTDWGDPPSPFKRYPAAPRVALPPPPRIAGGFELAALGSLLWHVAGVTAVRGGIALRASPSSGALFATELYVVARAVGGLESGLWHYEASSHALERLAQRAPDLTAWVDAGASGARDAPVLVIATAVFARSGHKYRDRTYRYVLADLGHALHNLIAAAHALGAHAELRPRFDESEVAAAIGVDDESEGVLAVVEVRPSGPGLAAPVGSIARPAPVVASAIGRAVPSWHAATIGEHSASPPGMTVAIHRATSLRAPDAAASPASTAAPSARAGSTAAAPVSPADPADRVRLPAAIAVATSVLERIAARRSIRRYAAAPLTIDALAGVLHAAAHPAGASLSQALRIDVVTLALDGLPAAAWRYDAARHMLQPRRRAAIDWRAAARAAALDQDVIGDAAAVVVISADRAAIAADPAGAARGYRHALIEAGMAGERIYLDAGGRGLGVCAVGAFYDDEAATLVGLDAQREWVLHFVAIGVPAKG